MKQKVYIFFAITILSVFAATPGKAGFYMKKKAAITATASAPEQPNATAVASTADESATPVITEQKTVGKKQGFFVKLFNRFAPHSAAIPQILYIILAILPLGWLGMGLNDNFNGIEWVLSLILYILMWLPGLIYTLIMMNKYY